MGLPAWSRPPAADVAVASGDPAEPVAAVLGETSLQEPVCWV